jgi:hypothetical protein
VAATRIQTKSTSGQNVNTLSLTLDSTTGAGNFLAIVVTCYYAGANAHTPWTVSDNNGSTVTQAVTDEQDDGSNQLTRIYYTENIAGRAGHQVSWASAGGNTYVILTVIEYSGVATTSSLDQTTGQHQLSASSYSSGATGSTTQADELLLGVHHVNDTSTTWTPDSGWGTVVRQTDGSFHQHQVQERLVSSTGTYASSGTASGTISTVGVIATFKAAAGGGGNRRRRFFMGAAA